MVAQNWIKALNTRLAETPSIGTKVGYGSLIVCVGVFGAVLVLIAMVVKVVNVIVLATLKALWDTKFDQAPDDENHLEHGLENGPEGLGYYSHGVRIDND